MPVVVLNLAKVATAYIPIKPVFFWKASDNNNHLVMSYIGTCLHVRVTELNTV